jgi:hypothetical protein
VLHFDLLTHCGFVFSQINGDLTELPRSEELEGAYIGGHGVAIITEVHVIPCGALATFSVRMDSAIGDGFNLDTLVSDQIITWVADLALSDGGVHLTVGHLDIPDGFALSP